MTDIEQRALEIWGPGIAAVVDIHNFAILGSAFAEMRERHEAYKQEVSDALVDYFGEHLVAEDGGDTLASFIIPKPKPDPLVETLKNMDAVMERLEAFRAALEALEIEIREKSND